MTQPSDAQRDEDLDDQATLRALSRVLGADLLDRAVKIALTAQGWSPSKSAASLAICETSGSGRRVRATGPERPALSSSSCGTTAVTIPSP
jgi:hypothetical protein